MRERGEVSERLRIALWLAGAVLVILAGALFALAAGSGLAAAGVAALGAGALLLGLGGAGPRGGWRDLALLLYHGLKETDDGRAE